MTNGQDSAYPLIRSEMDDYGTPNGMMPVVAPLSEGGLTKREHFAGLVLQGILANPSFDILEPGQYAHDAVSQADALIDALNKEQK